MTQPAPPAEQPAAQEATEPKPAEFDADTARAEIKKKNSEAANLRARLKELEPLAERARQLEEAGKSEAEKQAAALQQARADAEQARLDALRLQVAFEKGLTPAQARRLVGTRREELEADADELLETFRPAQQPPAPPPNYDGGPRTTAKPSGKEQGLAEARRRFGAPTPPTT